MFKYSLIYYPCLSLAARISTDSSRMREVLRGATLLISFLLAAMTGMSMPAPLAPDSPACKIEPRKYEALLSATYDDFDQSMSSESNWRVIMNAGCYETAVSIIDAYLKKNSRSLSDENKRNLNFHAGQVLAFGGFDAKSAPYFERARGGSDAEWNAYVDATLAFIRNDKSEFEKALDRYIEVALNSPRREVLNSLLACFGQPYSTASMCPKK